MATSISVLIKNPAKDTIRSTTHVFLILDLVEANAVWQGDVEHGLEGILTAVRHKHENLHLLFLSERVRVTCADKTVTTAYMCHVCWLTYTMYV